MENKEMRIFSGLAILLIMLGHLNGADDLTFFGLFPYYSFHLPLFVFVSGYFYSSKNGFFALLKKRFKSLILPFYVINLFLLLFSDLIRNFGFNIGLPFSFNNWLLYPLIHTQPLTFGIASWFVLYLFYIQIVFKLLDMAFIKRIQSTKVYILSFLLILLCSLSVLIFARFIEMTSLIWIVVRVIISIPFYYAGYLYKLLFESKMKVDIRYFSFIIFFQLLMILKYKYINFGLWGAWDEFKNKELLFYMVGFNGTFFWLGISKLVNNAIDSKILVKMGRSSMYIMYFHLFGYWVFNSFIFIINKLFGNFDTFDITKYKSQIYYSFIPGKPYIVLYLIFGVVISLGIEKVVSMIKRQNLLKKKYFIE